jgi:hypothetical protein
MDGDEGDDKEDGETDDGSRTVRGMTTTSAPPTVAPSPAKGMSAAIGDTFRNVRATSLSAFSPFRSRLLSSSSSTQSGMQDGPAGPGRQRDTSPQPSQHSGSSNLGAAAGVSAGAGMGGQKRRSQSSISRWFGGGDDTSESEDEGMHMGRVDEGAEGSARSRSPDDFGGSGMGASLIGAIDDDDDDDEGAVIELSDSEVEGGFRSAYSPPQQDPEESL